MGHDGIKSLLSKNFVIFTGLSGSGKTREAALIAGKFGALQRNMDVFQVGTVIPSARKNYIISKSDSLALEIWNDEDEQKAVRVCLPRAIVQEWVDCIVENDISHTTGAREIREIVKSQSKFSDQLHSFETHLKALAFFQIENQIVDERANSLILPVGSDWSNRDALLGYPDGLNPNRYISTPTLSLILRAQKSSTSVPFFLILDEMNLSHVERYFADFLSAMESGQEIPLYEGEQRFSEATSGQGTEIPNSLSLPDNLFVIGTVNVDETTYQFSPKVLDRANVIEFRMADDSIVEFFAANGETASISGSLPITAETFVEWSRTPDVIAISYANKQDRFAHEMDFLFHVMRVFDAEFGYRTLKESARYIYFSGASPATDSPLTAEEYQIAMDAIIIQKLLPKLHGSRSKLEGLLRALLYVCETPERDDFDVLKVAALESARATKALDEIGGESPHYPRSHDKLKRMCRKLARDQFVSFAEA